jgi:hypothetical protein
MGFVVSALADERSAAGPRYQPSNSTAKVTLALTDYICASGATNPKVVQVTALEQPIKEPKQLPVSNNKVTFSMERALSTLKLSSTSA